MTDEERKAYMKEYRLRNKDKIAAYHKEYNKEYKVDNKEKLLTYHKEYNKEYYTKNKDKIADKGKSYRVDNKDKLAARSASTRADKLNATPEWVNIDDIRAIYKDCNDVQWLSEESLEVDHIIPLTNSKVCGLHVPWNLQILTRSENRRKSNKLIKQRNK